MPPYAAYLVFGKIFNALNEVVANASLQVITSIGNKTYKSDSSGIYLFDLAEIGYGDGEIVKVNVIEPFNNEYKEHTFVVENFFNQENISLIVRTIAIGSTGYSPKSIIHTVGNKPVTSENLFETQANIPQYSQRRTPVTGATRTEYIGDAAPGTLTSIAKWRIKKIGYSGNASISTLFASGTSKFDKIWDNRKTYEYS